MVAWILAASLAEPVALIGIEDVSEAALAAAASALSRGGREVITQAELRERLTGVAEPRRPDEEGLAKLLDDASRAEAHFDTAGANALRAQVLRAFATVLRPTPKVRELAARAAQDTAAALLAEKHRDAAIAAARDALLWFDMPLDATRHSQDVFALFEQARRSLAAGRYGTLRIITNTPGSVLIEGLAAGAAGQEVSRRLPVGRYRVWLITDHGEMSLPQRVDLTADGATLTLDADLDRRLRLEPVVSLHCQDCAAELAALGRRAGLATVFAVGDGQSLQVNVAAASAVEWVAPGAELTATDGRIAKFRPLYLVPFGVGQFAQDRPIYGGSYAAAQVGLLIWHATVFSRHRTAERDGDFDREPELREQRNRSAIFLYSALAASVVEAVVVGLVRGEGVVVP
ncbi:MAG: hypothetical protein HYZ27_08520 [Deltaproteobacteria bacterium]|nr:hypothetical protein [Deltaproteobacteria bacterium]